MNYWERVAVPEAPDIEEKEIFNQILQTSFSGLETFSRLSEETIKKIAVLNHMLPDQVRRIYQDTILWQQAQQFCHQP